MTSEQINKRIAAKLAEARALNESDEEMSDESVATLESILADVAKLKEQLEAISKLDVAEAEVNQSRRLSKPVLDQPVAAPAAHTKRHRYSILRGVRLSLEGKKLDGLEGEISRDIELRSKKTPRGFFMPSGAEPEYRDLTTTTGTGAVFVVPELPFIEVLRNRTVVRQLGCTFLTGMEGKFSIPRQSGQGTAYWVTEESTVTGSNQTLDQVAFVDKTLGAYTDLSRKFIYQSSVDAEEFVKNDLARVLAIELDRAALNGNSSGAVPTGILQNSTIQTNSAGLALGTSGGAPTFAAIVNMETQVASYNADRGKLAYCTTPAARGTLKTTAKLGSTYPLYIWEGMNTYDSDGFPEGEMNGYRAVATNQMPSNLTKGSGSNLSSCIFGNWEDLVVAQWGGIDVIVNPYTNSTAGTLRIVMLAEFDVEVRHPESFAIISDMATVAY